MATKKAREAIAALLHDSGVWNASRMHISNEQDVFASEIDGPDRAKKRVAAVADMIDEDNEPKGEWALFRSVAQAKAKQASGEEASLDDEAKELFERVVLTRLAELEKATGAVGGSVRHLTQQVAARQSISVNIPDARLKEITAKAANEVHAQHVEYQKRLDRAARYNLICAAVCLALVLAVTGAGVFAYNRGYDVGRAVSKNETAAASWANTPQGRAAHDMLVGLSEPTKSLLVYCNNHNWEGGAEACFASARRANGNTIDVSQIPKP